MELAELAVKKAIKAGMDEAEAYVKKNTTISMQFASEIQNIKTTESLGLGLRVALGKKIAMQATTILSEEEIDSIVNKAVKIAKVSPEDPNWNHLPKKFGQSSVDGVYDKTIENLDYNTINDVVLGAINKASENDRKVKVTRGVIEISYGFTSIVNNYNETLKRRSTNNGFVFYTKAVEGGDSTGVEFNQARYWKDLNCDQVADDASNKALRYVNAKPLDSTKLPVIMKNNFFGQIVGLMLGSNINAENIQKGRSTFGTKINEQIAAENISLLDDGTLNKGIATREFDDDGHPTQKTEIVSKGVLKNIIFDHYTSLKAQAKSTGNAGRNYWLAPMPTTNNLIFSPGTTSFEDMIKETKKGLLIEDTIGEWLSKPTSGELNATVTHGYLIENGELTKPVNNVVIAGNFFDILLGKIDLIGNDVVNNGKVYAPSVRVSELSIAGK